MGVLITCWTIEYFAIRYQPKLFEGLPHFFHFLFYTLPLILYAALVRFFWKTKFACPRVFDPYSSLNLSDDKMKMRGRSYTGLP